MNVKNKFLKFFTGYSADGTSTIENLTSEKKKLEARLAEIPALISQLNHSITVVQTDLTWVKELNGLKKRKWEKDKNVVAEEWIRLTENNIVKMQAQIASLNAEKSRIPEQIQSFQNQIDTLVKGQSVGLERGLDEQTARELGQLELEKEKARLAQEQALQAAQLKAQQENQQQAQQKVSEEKAGSMQTKIFIGIGVAIVLTIIGIILYRRFATKNA